MCPFPAPSAMVAEDRAGVQSEWGAAAHVQRHPQQGHCRQSGTLPAAHVSHQPGATHSSHCDQEVHSAQSILLCPTYEASALSLITMRRFPMRSGERSGSSAGGSGSASERSQGQGSSQEIPASSQKQLLFWLIRLICTEPTLFLHEKKGSLAASRSSSQDGSVVLPTKPVAEMGGWGRKFLYGGQGDPYMKRGFWAFAPPPSRFTSEGPASDQRNPIRRSFRCACLQTASREAWVGVAAVLLELGVERQGVTVRRRS